MVTGRNDPCPCGSGRKFKHCCLGQSKMPCSSGRGAEAFAEIRQAMEGREFDSFEELQTFVCDLNGQHNRRPIDDFHGLSPDQMYRLMHFPFDSPDLVEFPPRLGTTPSAPILSLFQVLTEAVGERGLKPTAAGNLPRKLVQEAALTYATDELQRELMRFRSIRSEDDFPDLNVTRLVAGLAGLIRKYRGRFVLSRDCRSIMAERGLAGIYPRLLQTYAWRFNWGYRDGYPDLYLIQDSFLFTLYLLGRHGEDWRSNTFYEDAFLRAFPLVLDEVPPEHYSTPEDTVRRCYSWRCLEQSAAFLGLVEIRQEPGRMLDPIFELRKLPLLDEAVIFKI